MIPSFRLVSVTALVVFGGFAEAFTFISNHAGSIRPNPAFSLTLKSNSWSTLLPHADRLVYTRSNNKIILFMGWGPDPIWSAATIVSNEIASESGNYVLVSVQVPTETAAEYKIPGQYIQLRLNADTKPLILAIASPPDAENAKFDFLIKKTDKNEWFTGVSPEVAVEISQVLGQGFNIAENLEGFKYDFPTQNILLFAAGSGLAPIKATIESGQLNLQESARTCRLYYGERTAANLALVDQFAAWERMGVEVVPVLSQPEEDGSWQGRSGYVQNALEEDGVAIPRNSGALLCGMKGMTESVKDILLKAGVFEGRVLLNF